MISPLAVCPPRHGREGNDNQDKPDPPRQTGLRTVRAQRLVQEHWRCDRLGQYWLIQLGCALRIQAEEEGVIFQKALDVHRGRKSVKILFFQSLEVGMANLGGLLDLSQG